METNENIIHIEKHKISFTFCWWSMFSNCNSKKCIKTVFGVTQAKTDG